MTSRALSVFGVIAATLLLGCGGRTDYDLDAQKVCLRLLADTKDTAALQLADPDVFPEGQRAFLLVLQRRAVRCKPFWDHAMKGARNG